MAVETSPTPLGTAPGELAQGQRFENLGFTWCKIGSIALIAVFPKPALMLASVLAIYYYARALALGVNRSCCILRHPLLIIAFWAVVFAATMASSLGMLPVGVQDAGPQGRHAILRFLDRSGVGAKAISPGQNVTDLQQVGFTP